MDNGYIAPVDHGVLSTTGSVAVGTVGGAARSIGKTALWCIGIGAAVGLLWATGLLPAAVAALTPAAGTGAAGASLGSLGTWIGGTVAGAVVGLLGAVFVSPIAGLF